MKKKTSLLAFAIFNLPILDTFLMDIFSYLDYVNF